MSSDQSVRISFRLDAVVHDVMEQLARKEGVETNAYMQRVLKLHAVRSGIMDRDASERIELSEKIIDAAVKKAQELYEIGEFDQHFVLTVFRRLMTDPEFRSEYEDLVGGDAYQSGLPGKSPINMYLGWYIKNAVGADPILDASGKPRRAQIQNEPIQSYTLLVK